jgi:hypothetical protein
MQTGYEPSQRCSMEERKIDVSGSVSLDMPSTPSNNPENWPAGVDERWDGKVWALRIQIQLCP